MWGAVSIRTTTGRGISMDTQVLKLDHMRDFSLYGSVGQVAKPQRSTSLSLPSVLRQTSTMILAGGQG